VSCSRASLIAVSFALAMHAGQQQASAPAATHWEHTLIRHEKFEDFDGGTGVSVRMALDPPLTLIDDNTRRAGEQPGTYRSGIAPDPRYESRVLEIPAGFNDALLSWNLDCPARAGCAVELRVGHKRDESWSPWMHVASSGDYDVGVEASMGDRDFIDGKIDVDYFTSSQLWDRVQYRIRARSDANFQRAELQVRRVVLCLSRRVDGVAPSSPAPHEHARIAVPFRSQKAEKADIAGKICSPTSVSMVMAYRGVDKPTAEVAERIFDPVHEIYGNWPRAVQGAYSFGVPGYLARFSKWSDVENLIAAGQPLVISIAAKEGELTGAPYPKTDGHLLVLCGFDAQGDVLVNDPAAADATKGQTTYRREQLDKVWLARGGTAYVFLPKER
jgi:hypothetical protein